MITSLGNGNLHTATDSWSGGAVILAIVIVFLVILLLRKL
jgi:hypothetical protein